MKHLFRGFSVDKDGTANIIIKDMILKGEWVVGSKINTFWSEYANRYIEAAIIPIGSKEIFAEGIQYKEVIKETVGQYIGITDRGNKEIFIGDILEGKNCRHTVVESRNGWRLVDEKGRNHTMAYIKFYEIVSNIFEKGDV